MACFPAIVKNDVFVAKICKYALSESSEGFCSGPRKPVNPCHPAGTHYNFSDTGSESFFRYQIFLIPVSRLFLGTKFFQYQFRDFFRYQFVPIPQKKKSRYRELPVPVRHTLLQKSTISDNLYNRLATNFSQVLKT